MRNSKLAFGTQTRRSLPFVIAGLTFFSVPLTVSEDLTLADLGDRYDLENADGSQTRAFLNEQMDVVAALLNHRVQGDPPPTITPEWAADHINGDTLGHLLGFLRTGTRPKEPLELQPWEDDTFTVQEREFRPMRLSFAEQMTGAGLMPEDMEDATTSQTMLALTQHVAQLLTSRAVDGGEPVTAKWLQANLGSDEVPGILNYLQSGPKVEAEAEGEDPNAEMEASGADGSPDSAA